MLTGMDLNTLAARIDERSKTKVDHIAPTQNLRLKDDGKTLAVSTLGEYQLTPYAHGQIADRLKIPMKYYQRMQEEAPELLSENVNTWFGAKMERRMIRTMGTSARAYLSDKYYRMDDDSFAEIVLPVAYEMDCEVISSDITELKTYIKVVSPRKTREVRVGEHVQFGLSFSNSEVGAGRITGALFAYKLDCLNGMTSMDDMFGKSHLGRAAEIEGIMAQDTIAVDGHATLLKMRDFARDLLSDRRLDEHVEKMRTLTGLGIGKPTEAVETLAKAARLNEGEKTSVLTHLLKGGQMSMWGLMNAVTRAAHDTDIEGLTYARATQLEALGGRILTMGPKVLTAKAEDYRILEAA